MITVQDAVREFGGRWQSPKLFLVVHRDGSYEFCDEWEPGTMLCSRVQFEQEAERQALETLEGFTAYTPPGFSGDPNDCAFKDEWLPPIGEECEFAYEGDEFHRCIPRYHGKVASVIDSYVSEVWVSRKGGKFRALKSDRERWVESAVTKEIMHDDCGMDEVFGRVYDALISGELPIPEAK